MFEMQPDKSNIAIELIEEKTIYDRFVSKSINVTLTQTWEYGEAKAVSDNVNIIRALILKGADPVAVVQMHVKGHEITINRGPVVLTDDWKSDSSLGMVVLSYLYEYWVKLKKHTLHITPNFFDNPDTERELLNIGFKQCGRPRRSSILVNLSDSEEQLKKNLHQKWRNQLNRAEQLGLSLEIATNQAELAYFVRQYEEAQREKNYSGLSDIFLSTLGATCAEGSNLKVFYAVANGQKIAAILVASFFDSCHYLAGWNSVDGRKFYAHNYLLWQGLRHCKLIGFKWFDMGGIDPEKHPSITFFKRGIGGSEYALTGEWEASP